MRTAYNPFPDPEHADDSGLLCIGGALDVKTLYAAYTRGIFPWPHQGTPLLWFTPADRGVLDFEDLHIARSLKRFMRGTEWQLTFDQDFAAVIRACSAVPRPGQEGTWITDEMIAGYTAFHEAGFAHSVECWHGDQLVVCQHVRRAHLEHPGLHVLDVLRRACFRQTQHQERVEVVPVVVVP